MNSFNIRLEHKNFKINVDKDHIQDILKHIKLDGIAIGDENNSKNKLLDKYIKSIVRQIKYETIIEDLNMKVAKVLRDKIIVN